MPKRKLSTEDKRTLSEAYYAMETGHGFNYEGEGFFQPLHVYMDRALKVLIVKALGDDEASE